MVLLLLPSQVNSNSKDLKKKTHKFLWVNPKMLHASKVLPKRDFSLELAESVRRDGVQQPIIVRPSHKSGMFEIIDGHLRHRSTRDLQKVLVDVRYDLEDTEVFKISDATFKRKPRNTYERALFYSSWVRTIEANRGAQTRVAKMANLSQAEVSHYLSINRLFESLDSQKISEQVFNALKNQSVNKLYALAKVEDQTATSEVAAIMAEAPDMNLKELKAVIEEHTSPTRAIDRLTDEDIEEEEESESSKIARLTIAVKELQKAAGTTRDGLSRFTSRVSANPHRFLAPEIFKRIRTMLNALKKIEKEANRIARSGRQTGVSTKHGGV